MKRNYFFSNYRVRTGILIAVAIGLTSIAWHRGSYLMADSYAYMHGAISFLEKGLITNVSGDAEVFFPPLYSLVLATVLQLTNDPEIAGSLVSAVASTASVFLAYVLASRCLSSTGSFIAALLFAIATLRVWLSQWVLADSLYLFLILSAIAARFCNKTRNETIGSFWAGLLLGLAYLAKPEAIGYIGCLLFFEIAVNRVQGFKRRLSNAFISVLIFACIMAPYILWLHSNTGEWRLSGKMDYALAVAEVKYQDHDIIQAVRITPEGKQKEIVRGNSSPTRIISRVPSFTRSILRRILYALGPSGIIAVLLALGLHLSIRDMTRVVDINALGIQLLQIMPIGMLLLFGPEDRRYLPYLPVCFLWVARGVEGLWCAGRRGHTTSWLQQVRCRSLRYLAGVAVALIIISHGFRQWTMHPAVNPVFLNKEVGAWMRNHLVSGTTLSQEPAIPFYAGMLWESIPYADLDGLIAYAHFHRLRYLIVTNADMPLLARDVALETPTLPQLAPIRQWSSENYHIWLYDLWAAPNGEHYTSS
jgi:hypothetical protein